MRRVLLVLCCAALASTITPATAQPPPTYQPPVDAEVVDGFRPPATRFGAGNRGLEYATTPGTEVRAAADWNAIAREFYLGAPPATPLGVAEAAFWAPRSAAA